MYFWPPLDVLTTVLRHTDDHPECTVDKYTIIVQKVIFIQWPFPAPFYNPTDPDSSFILSPTYYHLDINHPHWQETHLSHSCSIQTFRNTCIPSRPQPHPRLHSSPSLLSLSFQHVCQRSHFSIATRLQYFNTFLYVSLQSFKAASKRTEDWWQIQENGSLHI